MENKIKELESSNRLLKLKLLSVPDQNDKQIPSEPNETHVSPMSYSQPSQSNGGDLAVSMRDLQNRVLSLEVKLLEQRLNSLETPQQWGGFGGHYWQNGEGFGTGSPYSPVYTHMSHSWLGNYPNNCSQQNAWSLPYSGCHVPNNNYYNWPDETPVYTSGNYYTHSVPSRDDTSPGSSDSHSYTLHPNVKHGSHTDIEYPTVHPVVHQGSNNAETGGSIDSASTIGRQIPVHFSHRGRRPNMRMKKPDNNMTHGKEDVAGQSEAHPIVLGQSPSPQLKGPARNQDMTKRKKIPLLPDPTPKSPKQTHRNRLRIPAPTSVISKINETIEHQKETRLH